MHIAVIGATGDLGRRVAAEALGSGHPVAGFSRSGQPHPGVDASAAVALAALDAGDPEAVAAVAAGSDLVIGCARPPHALVEQSAPVLRTTAGLLDGCATAGTPLLLVGGCGSLRSPNGPALSAVDDPTVVPDQWRPIAHACKEQWELCRDHPWRGWTHICPPAILAPGVRTGGYLRGRDTVLVDRDGGSRISMEDFAIAMLDEAERPRAVGDRFTVVGFPEGHRDECGGAGIPATPENSREHTGYTPENALGNPPGNRTSGGGAR